MVLEDAQTVKTPTPTVEPLLSSRLFMAPQLVGDRLFFISNMGGKFSLYAMDRTGSVPEPLLPPDIALQNPELIDGHSFYVLPSLNTIVVVIDNHGDENYQPRTIPIDGGIPADPFNGALAGTRSYVTHVKPETNTLYLLSASHDRPVNTAYAANVQTGELTSIAESPWGALPVSVSEDGSRVLIGDGYTPGDTVLSLWESGVDGIKTVYGTPIEEQPDRTAVVPNGINSADFTSSGRGILLSSAVFEDTYSPGYLDLSRPGEIRPVALRGVLHAGAGEMEGIAHLAGDRYTVSFNIDGVSWLYEAAFDEAAMTLTLERVLVGEGVLANGTLEHVDYDRTTDAFALAFSTATTPIQLFVLDGPDRTPHQVTRERIIGISHSLLAPGEDASFTSFDGLRISARLYLPAEELGHAPPHPLVYYIHGGPQGQERPNFAWFSMPLIQFLTLNGFAVFVPNVRGSTGYGQRYMKFVDHDWGGDDRLDHVHAMTEVLSKDARIDVSRAGVMGRSYGGYMTLTLASRHPDLWRGAIDMFGPYNLLSFMDRLPETWKSYFRVAVGDPDTDRDFLLERSPYTYMENISCPLFVIQGKNDPRVVEQESRDVVEALRAAGKEAEYLMFENEGHDVIKYENKVRCYTAINEFFNRTL
jgi:pimeloyl-ACP methyl ester carboxylesterase